MLKMVLTKPFFPFSRSSTLPTLRDAPYPSGTCHLHRRPLMIYCTSCANSLCDECLIEGVHRGHVLAKFEDVFQKHIEEVTRRSKQLASSLRKQVDIKTSAAKAKTYAEQMFEQTRVNLEKQYQKLQELVDHNKQQAFRLLLAQKESLLQDLDTLATQNEQNQQMMFDIEQELLQLKSSLDCESSAALLKIKELDTNVKAIEDFYRHLKKQTYVDNKRLKGLENSVNHIVEESKELLTRPWKFAENITFDETTASGNLKTSADKTTVYCTPSGPQKQYTKQRENAVATILATQSFTSGCHYWEVKVKDLTGWTVGVVDQDWKKKRREDALGQDRSSWALQFDHGMLIAMHDSEMEVLREEHHVEQLGIFLDFNKGMLRFFNVDTGCVLHTFFAKFKTAIYPAFSIKNENTSIVSLTICKLVPTSDLPVETAVTDIHTAM